MQEEQSIRSTRNQPFCWQPKMVLRKLKEQLKDKPLEHSKHRNLYLTLTQIDSDFNGKEIIWYTKTIATYSGLSKDWIPKGLQLLADSKIITIMDIRDDSGRFAGRSVHLNDVLEHDLTVPVKSGNGEDVTGKSCTLEDISCIEDIKNKKEKKVCHSLTESQIRSRVDGDGKSLTPHDIILAAGKIGTFKKFEKYHRLILEQASIDHPGKDVAKVMQDFVYMNGYKNYGYSDYKLAYYNWVRNSKK